MNEGRRGFQNRFIRFSHNCGFKNKNINLRDFKDVDFNFTHFADFNFAYFEIEESFELIWIKLQNGPFWVLKRCSFQVKALFLPNLCIIEVLDKFG